MTRMTGGSASVERKIGREISKPNGDNDRPYGKCYGQVGGVSYPCTQRAPEEERKAAPSKAAYQSAKRERRSHNAVKVRCVETGEVYASKRKAAMQIGVGIDLLEGRLKKGQTIGGRHYEVVR